uniref:Uncharacterized protein n=1 Tax=Plectus sambesii TaxID=2011161 RepID=A0A914W7S5_9BILA
MSAACTALRLSVAFALVFVGTVAQMEKKSIDDEPLDVAETGVFNPIYRKVSPLGPHLLQAMHKRMEEEDKTFERDDRDYRPLQFGKRDYRPLQFGKRDYRPLQFGKRDYRPLQFGKRDYRPLQFGKRDYRPLQFGKKDFRPLQFGK